MAKEWQIIADLGPYLSTKISGSVDKFLDIEDVVEQEIMHGIKT